MKRTFILILLSLIAYSCTTATAVAQKEKKFPKGINLPSSEQVTNVDVNSRLLLTDPQKRVVEISLQDLASQLSVSGGGLSQEDIEDLLGNSLQGGTHNGATFIYDDATGTISVTIDQSGAFSGQYNDLNGRPFNNISSRLFSNNTFYLGSSIVARAPGAPLGSLATPAGISVVENIADPGNYYGQVITAGPGGGVSTSNRLTSLPNSYNILSSNNLGTVIGTGIQSPTEVLTVYGSIDVRDGGEIKIDGTPLDTSGSVDVSGKADLTGATFTGPLRAPDPIAGNDAVIRSYMELSKRVSPKTATSPYAPILGDASDTFPYNTLISIAGDTEKVVTVPHTTTMAFEIGQQITFIQEGNGPIAIYYETGVEGPNVRTIGDGKFVTLIKFGQDKWIPAGGIETFVIDNNLHQNANAASVQNETFSTDGFTPALRVDFVPVTGNADDGSHYVSMNYNGTSANTARGFVTLTGIEIGDTVQVTFSAREVVGNGMSVSLNAADGWDITDSENINNVWAPYTIRATATVANPPLRMSGSSITAPGAEFAIDGIIATKL